MQVASRHLLIPMERRENGVLAGKGYISEN
jgi:hypothetical protein